ncbi:TPA: hypothetical protein U2C93_001438 [Streptococcus suis]|uniref:hypothetical protein n=1 Tax=Streptococcus suis TaxID=1307 RepID=UPI000CF4359F|nr:hypothetical protein [Streptococcus suis]MCB2922222.1 hypothetical protein [Streptococcus suis]MCB2932078.1 hypothetical protein [Streptococcus suis]MCB2941704.1 hypothetical protein [Streptococcus suis]MCB2945776.1 hypothetical protein [Streptococcus suis]MCB2955690.1 hypothetical protein [Streptococcus suis]
MKHSVIYTQKYFAIVEDDLKNKILEHYPDLDFSVYPLDDTDNWDKTIERYQNMNKQYVVVDEDDLGEIPDYF